MKKSFISYRGVSLRQSDVIKFAQRCFTFCLGFSPSTSSFCHVCSYPTSYGYTFEFCVCSTQYNLVGSVENGFTLVLITDQYGGSYPDLGFVYDWAVKDFLDDIVKNRVEG